MAILCPYCNHSMAIKSPKAGRFSPKCAKCGQAFILQVTLDPEPVFKTAKIVSDPNVTAPSAAELAPPAVAAKPKAAPAKPANPDVTAAEPEAEPVRKPATRPQKPANLDETAFDPPPQAASKPPAKKAATPAKGFNPDATAADPVLSKPQGGNLDATMAGDANSNDNADFSMSASAVRAGENFDPDATAAAVDTSMPPRKKVTLDATEFAEDSAASGAGEEDDRSAPASEDDFQMPEVLGGYRVEKELGRGGMGAVYLARQVSLDRPVALKVMNATWASNPNFLVRFTREAYAAAQLVHHNVVQVYDIGADKGINYFSMEFVKGRSLGDMCKKEGKIDAQAAAGYILQAARGLKFAHDRGMIHRDIKPDNLMINDQGVVKVADLGLVRTPGVEEKSLAEELAETPGLEAGKMPVGQSLASLSNVTMANQAMGTPSYMAPEQARDATKVDHRADIYSLGCTLYVMLTGKPVFTGESAMDVMAKHATEPVRRPELIAKEVPKALSDIIMKMLAKKPDDRYQSMDEVIKVVEDFLGLQKNAKAEEKHIRTLEQSVKAFTNAPMVALRGYILLGCFLGVPALAVLLMLFGVWSVGGALIGLTVSTALAYFVVNGSAERSHVFLKVRDFLSSLSLVEWGKVALGVVLLLGVLYLVGQLPLWLLSVVLGIGLSLGVHYSMDRKIAVARAAALEKVERMLKDLRLRGLSEEALQEFVCMNAGDHWEEFFEALFGYEAKLAARTEFVTGGKPRPKFAAWREPLIRSIDKLQQLRREAKERAHLQKIEQKNLEAQGVSASEAKQQAEAVAEAMVQKAAEIKKEAPAPVLEETAMELKKDEETTTPSVKRKAPAPKRVNVQDLMQVAEAPKKAPPRPRIDMEDRLNTLFGPSVRFVISAVLLLISLYWMSSNRLLPSSTNFDEGGTYSSIWARMKDAKPLAIPAVPEIVMQALCSVNALAAGTLLLLSAMWFSWKIGSAQILATIIMVIGPVLGVVPELFGLTPQIFCLVIGAGISVLGFLFGRDTV